MRQLSDGGYVDCAMDGSATANPSKAKGTVAFEHAFMILRSRFAGRGDAKGRLSAGGIGQLTLFLSPQPYSGMQKRL